MPRRFIVVRHGQRLDEVDSTFAESAAAPWDPPLTEHAQVQCREASQRLRDAGFDKIDRLVSSPLLRCLQTSHAVLREHGALPLDKMCVHMGLAEHLNARNTRMVGREDDPALRDPQDWLFGPGGFDGRAVEFSDAFKDAVIGFVGELPEFPESVGDSCVRYERTLRDLATGPEAIPEDATALCVTHGQAVTAIYQMIKPDMMVYQCDHLAYVALEWTGGPDDDASTAPSTDAAEGVDSGSEDPRTKQPPRGWRFLGSWGVHAMPDPDLVADDDDEPSAPAMEPGGGWDAEQADGDEGRGAGRPAAARSSESELGGDAEGALRSGGGSERDEEAGG
ncbi:unnamed protein product [Pedinophyceae sp. YPF-701]|nr:unnamed protein product [Pedinophyceae sp. YPF-701]